MTVPRYALEFAPKAIRSLGKLDRPVAKRIRAVAEALRDDPRPLALACLYRSPEGSRTVQSTPAVHPAKKAILLRRLHSFDGRLQRENKTSHAIDLALM